MVLRQIKTLLFDLLGNLKILLNLNPVKLVKRVYSESIDGGYWLEQKCSKVWQIYKIEGKARHMTRQCNSKINSHKSS